MRSRNIKPGFFKNEDLAEIGPYAQLLFVGLWQLADKGGKLEDRPKRIKAEVFPYYDPKPSVETLLQHLIEKSFIIRYKVSGLKLLKIVNFEKHQSPHHTEKKSIYPDPCEAPLITSDSPSLDGEATVSPPLLDGGNPPDSLIPDSLITDSLIPGKKHIAPPGPSDAAGALPPVLFFSCPYFDIDFDYRMKLAREYPALNDDLLRKELSKAEDWISDNAQKKKFKANGHLANPKLFIKNWLDRVGGIFGPGSDKPKGFAAVQRWSEKGGENGSGGF